MQITLTVRGLKQAREVVENSPKILVKVKDRLSKRLAEEGLKIIRRHIINQDLPWAPLSKEYLATKVNQRLSENTYEATGEFAKNIQIRKDSSRDVWRIGAFSDVPHKASGLSMHRLGMILEYGCEEVGIPARPLFRPSAVELQRKIRGEQGQIKNEILKEVMQSIQY